MTSQARAASELTLVFDISRITRQSIFGGHVTRVPDLTVDRESTHEIRQITFHLKQHLSLRDHTSYFLLLEAVCAPSGFPNSAPCSTPSSRSDRPYVIPLVCDQVWAAVLKSYRVQRLKVVVRGRPFVNTPTFKCRSLFSKRELKFVDMISYFPKVLREEHLRRIAEDIFLEGLRIKPRLRKGVWPHLVRVFHPGMETREERESYLSKLRMIYDALKGRLQSHGGSPAHSNQHLYDSIRRDAVRTDPAESFYRGRGNHGNVPVNGSVTTATETSSYLSRENIERLVNITAVYTLEHGEVSYTQGMTDLLSPILFVMEREDDAYIVFSAMVQRISENFGMWCEGTLKKVERLRHLCSVLDPELSAHLTDIEEDAFALFFGMVLIECRREFSFDDSFHLMEVIWSAALCMRQREDPNWCPPTLTRKNDRGIQAFSPELSLELGSIPSHSEWASFMSNRSPDVIRQVFGELQTYTAVPLSRSECGSLSLSHSHRAFLISQSPPPPLRRSSLVGSTDNERFQEVGVAPRNGGEVGMATGVVTAEVYDGRNPETTSTTATARDQVPAVAVVREWPHLSVSQGKDRSLSDPIKRRATQSTCGPGYETRSTCLENRFVAGNDTGCPSAANDSEMETNGNAIHATIKKIRKSCSASDLSPSPPSSPPIKMATRPQTEMSDMSSVGSTNASGGTAANDRGCLAGSVGSEGGRNEGGREGEVREKGEGREEENGDFASPKLDANDDFTILADDTPRHSAAAAAVSPSTQDGTDSTLREASLTREYDYPPVSPVQPFFDTLETIATMPRPHSPAPPPGGHAHSSSGGMSAAVGNLLSMEHPAPAVSRESSLAIPFSDSFPLFICLSIIIQQRSRILKGNLDFVGLSILLNTQAGSQNLEETLRIARRLYRQYSGYQRLCFGPRFAVYEVWLDNMGSLFAPLPTATSGQHVRNRPGRRGTADDEENERT